MTITVIYVYIMFIFMFVCLLCTLFIHVQRKQDNQTKKLTHNPQFHYQVSGEHYQLFSISLPHS